MAITVSDVDICNVAISALGGTRINSIGQDTNEGRLCAAYFPLMRDTLLADHKWNFAITRVVDQANLTVGPKFGWMYRFLLPENCLRVLDTSDVTTKWVVEDGYILANITPLSYLYVFRQSDVSKWSPVFALALSKGLESLMAVPLTGRAERHDVAWKELGQILQMAKGIDGQEGFPAELFVSDLEDVR